MCIRFYRLCTDRVPAHRIALRAAPHALTLKKGTVKIQKVNGKVAGLKRASCRSVTPARAPPSLPCGKMSGSFNTDDAKCRQEMQPASASVPRKPPPNLQLLCDVLREGLCVNVQMSTLLKACTASCDREALNELACEPPPHPFTTALSRCSSFARGSVSQLFARGPGAADRQLHQQPAASCNSP